MNTKKVTGLVGSILLGAGVFTPIYSTALSGKSNYIGGGGDGLVILILAVISLIFILLNKYKVLWFTGIFSSVVMGITAFTIYSKMSRTTSQMASDMASEMLKGSTGEEMLSNTLANISFSTLQFQWGWAVLLLGLILIFISILIKKSPSEENATESIEERGMTVKQFVIKFAWLYPLSGLILGGVMSAIGIKSSAVGTFLIMVIMMILLEQFGKKNKRYLTEKEEKTVFWSVLSVFMAIQGLIVLAYIGVGKLASSNALMFSLFFALFLGTLMIHMPIKIMKKNLIKRNIIDETLTVED